MKYLKLFFIPHFFALFIFSHSLKAMNEEPKYDAINEKFRLFLNSLLKISDSERRWPNNTELAQLVTFVANGAHPETKTDHLEGIYGGSRLRPLHPRSAIHFAGEIGNVSLIEFLLSQGADINAKAGNSTALAFAAYYHKTDAFIKLVELGAEYTQELIGHARGDTYQILRSWFSEEISLPDEQWIHRAIRLRDSDLKRTLVCYDQIFSESVINLLDFYQQTPLDIALARQDLRGFLLLLFHGADIQKGRFKPYIKACKQSKSAKKYYMLSPIFEQILTVPLKDYLSILAVCREELPKDLINLIVQIMLASHRL